mmetsp:Transcript_35893/g.92756  ORF Transcript_35893/g.92756 Transcript_35893/m.92756 type:complete len:271 (+) Transcript_35893:1149-1961(+)
MCGAPSHRFGSRLPPCSLARRCPRPSPRTRRSRRRRQRCPRRRASRSFRWRGRPREPRGARRQGFAGAMLLRRGRQASPVPERQAGHLRCTRLATSHPPPPPGPSPRPHRAYGPSRPRSRCHGSRSSKSLPLRRPTKAGPRRGSSPSLEPFGLEPRTASTSAATRRAEPRTTSTSSCRGGARSAARRAGRRHVTCWMPRPGGSRSCWRPRPKVGMVTAMLQMSKPSSIPNPSPCCLPCRCPTPSALAAAPGPALPRRELSGRGERVDIRD